MRSHWAGYGTALWAAIFAVLHVIWASGWHVGLPRELAREAFRQRWFLIYDLVVAGMCAVATWVALGLVRPWGVRLRRLICVLAWSGTGLLVLRGGTGVLQTAHLVATGRRVLPAFSIWDVWFCLVALLFGVGTWRFWRASRGVARA